MGCTSCLGRYGLLIASIVFTIGMLTSTTTPSWLRSTRTIEDLSTSYRLRIQYEFGPFNSRTRNCTHASGAVTRDGTPLPDECTDWETSEISKESCRDFTEIEQVDKLCTQQNTWRILAMMCLFIVLGTAICVGLATFTQCLTCGCCGGSFDMIASVAYWIEVALSIVAWSFAISVVMMLKDQSITDLVQDEFDNIQNVENVTDLTEGNFLWGFWVFIFSGTFLGAVCATFAGWAAEGSFLKCFADCFACVFCCKK